jgi:hypothetical protein
MNQNSTSKIDSWTVSEILDSLSDAPRLKKRVIIPRYQRSLVWNDVQRTEFIQSIKRGFPIGSFLLYNRGPSDGFEQYALVDGLQRVNTLKRHEERRPGYFLDADVPPDILAQLVTRLDTPAATKDSMQRTISDWIRSLTSFDEVNHYSAYDLLSHLCETFGVALDPQVFKHMHDDVVAPFLKAVKDSHDVSDVKIPVVIYNGPEYELPEIFERLNSQGTQLSKYEIYAATWSHDEMNIPNADIVAAVKERYDSIVEQGMTIEGYDPDDPAWTSIPVSLTSFEYVYGLGKWLSEKYPGIFSPSDKSPNKIDSAAFNLCTTCLGLKISDMGKLSQSLKALNTTKLEKCLAESIDWVSAALLPVTRLKLNAKDPRKGVLPSYSHTEFQIVSMIGRSFRAKYSPSLEVRSGWETRCAKLKQYLVQHYLFDTLRHVWAGTGDKQVDELVQDESRYEGPVYKSAWKDAFRESFNTEIARRERNRSLRDEDLLFLRYIYGHTQSAYDDAATDHNYQVEHLVPVGRLRKMDTENRGLPINCVANLALLQEDINNEKKEMTIPEYYDSQVACSKLEPTIAEQQEQQTLEFAVTTRSELTTAVADGIDGYKAFLRGRFDKLESQFMSLNKIEEDPGLGG